MTVEDVNSGGMPWRKPPPPDVVIERLREENRKLEILIWHLIAGAGGSIVVSAELLDFSNTETMSIGTEYRPATGETVFIANGGDWPTPTPTPRATVKPNARGQK